MHHHIMYVEKKIDYVFRDKSLLQNALTHQSVSIQNYERLELLGDRVLNMVVMEMLYHTYPNENEGNLSTRLNNCVDYKTCAEVLINLDIPKHINGPWENLNTKAIFGDVMEAIIGAMYVDGGFDKAKSLINANWRSFITKPICKNSKMVMQEWAQGKGYPTPKYVETKREGPNHDLTFTVVISCADKSAVGMGKSKKEAEIAAAKDYIESYIKN